MYLANAKGCHVPEKSLELNWPWKPDNHFERIKRFALRSFSKTKVYLSVRNIFDCSNTCPAIDYSGRK